MKLDELCDYDQKSNKDLKLLGRMHYQFKNTWISRVDRCQAFSLILCAALKVWGHLRNERKKRAY